jgi:selenocysteine lyase/cysteine desulfurase
VKVNLATGQVDFDSLASVLGKKTKLLAIGAGSNALGTITDVQRAGAMAHAVGALVFVDAVHYAPHALVDVHAMDCDFLGCSAYKFYGPHAGMLYGRQALIEALNVPRLDPAPNWSPERLETGTQNHEGIVGTGAAIDFLAHLSDGATRRERLVHSFAALHARGQALLEQLWTGLGAIPGVTLYGPTPDQPRTPTVAFTVEGHSSEAVARHLAELGVFVSNGDFYASTIIGLLGHAEDGVVRAGCSCYTSADEVQRLISGVQTLRQG